MKKLKYICVAVVMLLVGVISAVGCNYDSKTPVLLSDITEIHFSTSPDSNLATIVTEKEDIDKITDFFVGIEYHEMKDGEQDSENLSKVLCFGVFTEETSASVLVYPSGFVWFSSVDCEKDYAIAAGVVDYEGLLQIAEELQFKYNDFLKPDFLRNVENIIFSIYPHDNTITFVNDTDDLNLILSILSVTSYNESDYGDKNGDCNKALCINVYCENTVVNAYVYPEGFAEVVIRNPEDGSYKYSYSEYGIKYDELLTILTDIREEARANKNA